MTTSSVYVAGRTFVGAVLIACAGTLALIPALAHAAEEMQGVKISAHDGKFEPLTTSSSR